MNKIFTGILTSMLLFSCIGKYHSDAQEALIRDVSGPTGAQRGDTLNVDLNASRINWKGTKLHAAGKHEGIVELRRSYLLVEAGRITGGTIVADMRSLTTTDIPAHEKEAVRNLNGHLRGIDFFDVENHPEAVFEITQASYQTDSCTNVTGNFTIKGMTRAVIFRAIDRDSVFFANFRFDRFVWGIAYKGSLAERTLVDRDIELTIYLKIGRRALLP